MVRQIQTAMGKLTRGCKLEGAWPPRPCIMRPPPPHTLEQGQNHHRGPRAPEHPTQDSQDLWSGEDKWGAPEGSGVGGEAWAAASTLTAQAEAAVTLDYPGGGGLWAGGGRPGSGGSVGRGPSALWYGGRGGGGAGHGAHIPPSVLPARLPGQTQSFQSFLMVRFHSQDRWSVLSSSVKRDLML